MLSINVRIDRAQRLVKMLEEDAPLLALRVAPLEAERQQSAKEYAADLIAHAKAEVERLVQQSSFWHTDDSYPQAAD